MLKALLLTLVIEGVVMLALTRSKTWLFYNMLCNAFTNPVLNLSLAVIYTAADRLGYMTGAVLGEILVVLAEM